MAARRAVLLGSEHLRFRGVARAPGVNRGSVDDPQHPGAPDDERIDAPGGGGPGGADVYPVGGEVFYSTFGYTLASLARLPTKKPLTQEGSPC